MQDFKPAHNTKNQSSDNRNILWAVVISLFILGAFHMLYEKPRQERLEAQRALMVEQGVLAAPASFKDAITAQEATPTKTIAPSKRFPIKTASMTGSIRLNGARIDDVTLVNYDKTLNSDEKIQLLTPLGNAKPYYAEFGWLAVAPNLKVPGKETSWRVSSQNEILSEDSPVTLTWNNGQGLVFNRTITVDENYLFTVRQTVENKTGNNVTLFPYGLINRLGIPDDYASIYILHEGPIGFMEEELQELGYDDLQDDGLIEFSDNAGGWIGITDKYWLAALIPNVNDEHDMRFSYQPAKTGEEDGRYQADYRGKAIVIPANSSASTENAFFAGAKKLSILAQYEEELNVDHLDLAIDFGWFYFITKPFFYMILWIHGLVGNMGVAIIFFTIFLRICMFPLANKAFRSMAKMKKLAPKLQSLKDKHGKDRQKLQQSIMELYQKEKVTPLSGCAPMIIQIPIFFALYKVLYVAIEMRHAPFFGWIQDLSVQDPTTIFNGFGLLPFDPPSFMMIGAWPVLMCLTLVAQQMLNPKPQDETQAKIMMAFPFFMTFILARFPAGLVVYWTCSNLFSVLQQYVIMRSMGISRKSIMEEREAEKAKATAEKNSDKKPEKKAGPTKPKAKKKKSKKKNK